MAYKYFVKIMINFIQDQMEDSSACIHLHLLPTLKYPISNNNH